MADPAGLLSSTEDELKSIAAEIKHLGQKAESAWQAYQEAKRQLPRNTGRQLSEKKRQPGETRRSWRLE